MSTPSDLVTLAELKRWLLVTSSDDDDVLTGLITDTSRAVASLLARPSLLPLVGTDVFDGTGQSALMLRRWPVISIASCTVGGVVYGPASAPGVGGAPGFVLDSADPAPPGRMQRLALRGARFVPGVQNVAVTYTAGYGIFEEAATVPSVAPFVITAAAPYGAFASDMGVSYANGPAMTAGAVAFGQYTVAAGAYTFAAADAGAAVTLNYGYVPADLARACLDWAADRYSYRGRIGQASRSLGGQETTSFIVKDMPAAVATLLQPYRQVVV
jgi:hypothetical protein